MDSFSQKYAAHISLKKAWKLLEDNKSQRRFARELDLKMDAVYTANLLKKAFFPWRTYFIVDQVSLISRVIKTLYAPKQKKILPASTSSIRASFKF